MGSHKWPPDLEEVFNHIVLPPQVPAGQDDDILNIGDSLKLRIQRAIGVLKSTTGTKFTAAWSAIETCVSLNNKADGRHQTFDSLLEVFEHLRVEHGVVPLYIAEQNAGLLMYRQNSDDTSAIIFEAFEASPLSKDILAASDALSWSFPDRAVQMPAEEFFSETFQDLLATFLDGAYSERLAHLAENVRKAGNLVDEVRNPVSPALITQMLLSLVQGIGGAAIVPVLQKRIRDEVSFGKGLIPWRRSPVWLVLRVAMQRQLQLLHGGELGYVAYKILLCTVLSRLLDECVDHGMSPWHVSLLQKKLGRKMAKLETRCFRDGGQGHQDLMIQSLLQDTAPTFKQSIENAAKHLEAVLLHFKSQSLRKIPRLPLRASKEDQFLSLPSSRENLKRRLFSAMHQDGLFSKRLELAGSKEFDVNLNGHPAVENAQKHFRKLSDLTKIIDTSVSDATALQAQIAASLDGEDITSLRCKVTAKIESLMCDVEPKTPSNMVINSKLLLEIFYLWVFLDILCVREFPLLSEYRPFFPPELLDVLQLPDLESMTRLRRVQNYIHHRHQSSVKKETLFSEGPESFAVRFAETSGFHKSLYESISAIQLKRREKKTSEWQKQCKIYNQLSNYFGNLACQCTYNRGYWDIKGCEKCMTKKKRNSMQMAVHEDYLPEDRSKALATVFELNVPAFIAAYRDMTWKIAVRLAYPTSLTRTNRPKSVTDLATTVIAKFGEFKNTSISISSTSKPFDQTHYQYVRMKCDLNKVLLPLGADFRLFDSTANIWIHEMKENLTLAHYFNIAIPGHLTPSLSRAPYHAPTVRTGPSSYEIVASRQNCPAGMSVHEFEAFQRLLSGSLRRWPTLLVELGSSNVDFGKEYTVATISLLTHQAGPMLRGKASQDWLHAMTHAEKLGEIHSFCQDVQFLDCFCDEIEKRFLAIEKNWRESNCMDTLITLVLRAKALTEDQSQHHKLELLLQRFRNATLAWTVTLRQEVMASTSDVTSKQASLYAFRAALLCRKTFSFMAKYGDVRIAAADLKTFVRASIALQQNLTVTVESMGEESLRLFKSDTIMCHELASTIRQAIKAHEYSVTEAVLDSIGLPSAAANETQPMATLDNWTHLKGESDGWISSTLRRKHPDPSQGTLPQHISFHITQGHLLIDGKTIGKLPDNIRENADVKAIFGSRHFLVYTSEMPGMSYRIATLIEEHMIHFGFRGKEVIVVSARKTGEVYEYVPSRVFVDGNNIYDLPRGLVDNCFHWLDKKLGQLEIRRDKSPWKQQTNGWTLNIHSLQVHRPGQVLVNPSSKTAALLRPIFEGFDDTQQMTIFQPIRSQDTLNVEFRHLELSFFVNENGALQCRELGAVVDSNQDAGTLYGYGSMIVLHDASDPQRRCLIAPLAELVWKPSNAHISVMAKIDTSAPRYARISEQGRAYARFDIDTTLGRLTCPPEPRLLFTKVQLHAFTSFPLPDPLTGRTGEEEACHTMLSGRLQPWVSLPNVCFGILGQMEMLVPKREYYPSNLKALQKVEWSKHLPAGLQNDRYIRILRDLVAKSDQLRPFEGREKSSDKGFAEFYEHWASRSDSHLHIRGEIQRARFECPSDEIEKNFPVQRQDTVYVSRGWTQEISCDVQQDSDCKASAIFQVVRMLRDKPRSLPMSRDMWTILQEWKRFGGFSDSVYMELQPISLLLDPHTVRDQWGDLVQICALSDAEETHLIMFTLAGLAFAPGANMDVIHLLAAYCYLPELRSIERPVELSYSDFIYNKELTAPTLKSLIRSYYVDFVASDIEAVGQDEINAAIEAQRLQHNAACAQECSRLVDVLMEQWPDHRIPPTRGFTSAYIHVQNAVKEIKALWQCLYDNLLLSNYIEEVEEAVLFIRTYPKQVSNTSSDDNQPNNAAPILVLQQRKFPTLLEIAPRILCPHFVPLPENVRLLHQKPLERPSSAVYEQPKEYAELKGIIASFDASDELLRRSYGQDLASSLRALEASSEQNSRSSGQVKANPISMSELQTAITNSEKHILATFQRIKSCFSVWPVSGKKQQHASGYNWLQAAGLWPRLTPVSILELLQSRNKSRLEEDVFKSLLQYGEALTFHQRLLRLFRALMKRDERRIQEELANDGHSNWKTTDYPDWLLMEIDSNMLIRDEQVTVATAMISPASGGNAVYQLNMGKGKTSMIVPMVMCVIADGQHLARLGVPKALLLPTAQVLQSRLGGLVGREVRHVAFSRRLLTQDSCRGTFSTFKHHHQQLTENRGIFIAAPEHMLAFKLSCEQGYVDGKDVELAVEMMQFHQYLRTHLCRDVLDESDFTLAVRTQLVYPSGTFTEVDGTPYRWELLQTLLSLVEGHVTSLATSHPHWINVVKRPHGGFPLIYILQSAIEDVIRELIVRDIVQGRVSFFRPSPSKLMSTRGDLGEKSLSTAEMQKLLELAMQDTTSDAAIDAAAAMFADTDAAANGLLLLRGLLHHNILLTCLKKRWNVQYGLHPQRWPIAVPYEARGVPSERSEFGHPDVTIIFTCLAFYYAGVNLEQFRQGLGHVLHHMDDPATEYEKWSAGDGTVALPEDLQHWNTVNVDDEGQMMRLWSCLRYARSVVNHYLNTFVFPLYCRQFSVKLEASAWDLPIFNQPIAGQGTPTMSNARTTGFSGTNDNKSMLPLTIKQYDLPGLQQTNAEVLTYLLQPRNRGYICTGGHGSTRWSEQELVKSLASSGIQIFIDAGAYILEKKNEDLARAWLAMAGPKIKAAVYFDEKDNRAWVVFRDETPAKAPLVSTPYIDRLEECIVYYDEAHTRGVDLQLPADAKGALTLALGQTKDHTVQAAMRLRQLQTTQSVVFYAPPEVDQSIRELCGLGDSVSNVFVNSANVVRWLLEQTCLANEQLGSLYASHGASFCRRTAALWKSQDTLKDVKTRHSLLSVLEQPERQSLKVMYGYSNAKSTTGSRQEKESRDKKKGLTGQLQEPCLKVFMNQLQKYNATGASSLGMRKGTFEEVEQEREVEVQVEQQRKTVRRKDIKALKFPGRVAAAIWNFVKTGFLIGGTGYETMFQYLAKTDIGCRYGVKALETRLFVSSEFQRTIESPGSGTSPADDFLRPVEWLIWSPASETGLVIIPEEFELLIHEIRRSRYVHLIAYAAPVTKNMLAFSSLRYYSFPALPENYTMPTWLPIEMGILAGRLYMDFDEAMYMAQYIGQPQESELDGVRGITPAKEFCSNTTTFLLEWLPLRRTAQEALHTTAAYVCQGRPLRPDHRFFSQSLRYSKLEEAGLVKAEDVTDQLGFGRLRIEDDNVKIKKEQTEP